MLASPRARERRQTLLGSQITRPSNQEKLVITGGSGEIGRIVTPRLQADFENIVIIDPVALSPDLASLANVEFKEPTELKINDALEGASVALHLATGSSRGDEGILEVDIRFGLKFIDSCVAAGVRRLVIASSNHAAGLFELDAWRAGLPIPQGIVCDPWSVAPDGFYGAAKVFIEAYAYFIARTTDLSISCLRIGTVREDDIPSHLAATDAIPAIPGGRKGRLKRFNATWLYHDDLIEILTEELTSSESWRRRFAVSHNKDRFWPLEIEILDE